MCPHASARMICLMSPTAGAKPPRIDGVDDTIRDFWASRPRRARRGRKIAGVAAGIGRRYGIDPVIVRIAFIVATIMGGFGPLVYLLAWLGLPEERDEVSPIEALFGHGRSSMSPPMTICLGLALIPVSGWAFGGMWFQGGGLVLLVLILGGLFLLHRSRGGQNRPMPTVTATGAPASFHAQETDVPDAASGDSNTTTAVPEEGWDPLGADPMDWDLPEAGPTPAEAVERTTSAVQRPKSRIGAATLGLALLTAAAGAGLHFLGEPWFTAAHVIGLALGVLGIGMVVGAFAGGGRGLVLLAVPLAVAGVVLTAAPFANLPSGGFGEIDETPRTLSELKPGYERTGGSIKLDLTELESTAPISTKVQVGMGEAVVIVPEDADVTYTCATSMGEADCLGRRVEGMGSETLKDTDLGVDGVGGQQITLDVSSRMGTVEVRRG